MEQGFEAGGYPGAMQAPAETLAAFSEQTYIQPWFIAQVFASAGDKEATLEWLEKGYEIKDPNLPYLGGQGIINELLKDDPRYQDLLRRMNLPLE